MRIEVTGLVLGLVLAAMLPATSASADDPYSSDGLFAHPAFSNATSSASPAKTSYDPYDPANCIGVDWDDKQALVVSKVIAAPRVNFIKSPYDDDFKAETCPAATDACRKHAYLVTGDLVLTGKTKSDFTCVSYQSPTTKKQTWTVGWLPSTALAPVAPMASPSKADWIGTWEHPGGGIEIKPGGLGGRLKIEG